MARRLKQPKESKIKELKTSSLLVMKNMRSVLGVDIALVVIIMIEPIANDIVYYFRCISTRILKKKQFVRCRKCRVATTSGVKLKRSRSNHFQILF